MRLIGYVNPDGRRTSFHFDYGITSMYGSTTRGGYAGSGTMIIRVVATLRGLSPLTVYHYRLVATSTAGTTRGADRTFGTSTLSPVALTGTASSVTAMAARLAGTVNPRGAVTSYEYDYGTSTSYGSSTAPVGAGYGGRAVAAPAMLTGLRPGTTYDYRLVAKNANGTTVGRNGTFTTSASGPGPLGIPGSWSEIFDDELDGSQLDTSKWSTGWFGSGTTPGPDGTEQDCYSPSQVSVSGGELDLSVIAQSQTCGGLTKPFDSGLISTNGKFQFTYGAFEARIWLPGTGNEIADWPGFWADGQNWPADGEIDVVEGLGGVPCYHFHSAGGQQGGCAAIPNVTAGWHTFAADWEPGSITYYYDGSPVWWTTSGVTSQPMYLILNLAVSSVPGSPDLPHAAMRVDYVRVWQHTS